MFDSTRQLQALLSSTSPSSHASRGFSVALAAFTAIANVTGNQAAFFNLLRCCDPSRLKISSPSRNSFALAVFIGVFRFHQRSATTQSKHQQPDKDKLNGCSSLASGIVSAAAVASAIGTLCLAPESRPAVVSLLSTKAATKLFRDFIANNPDFNFFQPLELLVFMAASGWIFSSGFFNPESYDKSHMKQIFKNVVLKQHVANELQEKYRQGLNPNPCIVRHPGRSCGQYAWSNFLQRVMMTSLRVYTPVHLVAWLLALRHPKVRSKSALTHLNGFAQKLSRSSAYSIGFVYFGWMLCCVLGKIGDRSHCLKKLQFFLSGAISSLAIFAESPARRRPIGLILTSYALVSLGNAGFRRIPWLQPGAGSVRRFLEAGCVATSMAIIISETLEGNELLQRILLGKAHSNSKALM